MAERQYGNDDFAMYRKMEDLLAREDIDAVLIAADDRWPRRLPGSWVKIEIRPKQRALRR